MARYAVDLSYHQGKISASKFKNEVLFGIIRVQAGYTFEDPLHKNYEQQFLDNDIPFGEYAYARYVSVKDAVSEAKSFLNRINKKVPKNKLRLAVDVEENDCYNKSQLVPATQAFVNTIKSAGYDCGIYSGEYFFNKNRLGNVKCDFRWIAVYPLHDNGTPQFRPTIDFDLWQFSSKGHLDGVPNNTVDLNLPANQSVVTYFTGKSATNSSVSKETTKWWTNYVTANLNVRSGRGTKYGVVLVLPKGSKVSYMGGSTKGNWGYIHYTNSRKVTYRGYVSMNYLSRTNPLTAKPKAAVKKSPAKKSSKPVQKWWTNYVTASALNLRIGRGTKYGVLLVLPRNTKVSYLGGSTDKYGWGYIHYTNSKKKKFSGYVQIKYINLKPVSVKKSSYKIHTVVFGDTLSEIARKYNTSSKNIAKLNGFSNVNRTIYPGMKLKV